MTYQFAAAVAKAKQSGYDSLTTTEKWEWHADVYGWRRARLGIEAEVHTSPPDPDGKWFDERRTAAAEEHYRGKDRTTRIAIAAQRPEHSRPIDPADAQPVMDQWARDHGYRDLADYQEREDLDYVDVRCNIAQSIQRAAGAAAANKGKRAFTEPRGGDSHALLKALGVSAKEEFRPSAEAMRQARVQLGIESEPEPLLPPAQAAE